MGHTRSGKAGQKSSSAQNVNIEVLPTKYQFIQMAKKDVDSARSNLKAIYERKLIDKDIYLFGCGIAINVITGMLLGKFQLEEYFIYYTLFYTLAWALFTLYCTTKSSEHRSASAQAASAYQLLEYTIATSNNSNTENLEI